MASAGIMRTLRGVLDLSPQPQSFEQHLKVNTVRSMVSASLSMTIGKSDAHDALQGAVRGIVAGTLGGMGANKIAELYHDNKLDYITHKLVHGVMGAGMGSILSSNAGRGALSGAIGGVIGEMVGEELVKELGHKKLTTVLGEVDETVMKAQLGSAFAVMLAGQDISVATFVAENAVSNNSYVLIGLIGAAAARLGLPALRAGAAVMAKEEIKGATTGIFRNRTLEGLDLIPLTGLTAYQGAQWIQDHPLTMDRLPEGIEFDLPGFIPEVSKPQILTTPIAEEIKWDEGFRPLEEVLPIALTTPQADDSLAHILTFNKKSSNVEGLDLALSSEIKVNGSRIRPINNRIPINSEYAGKVYPLEKLPVELRQKYPHSVPFTGTGHPDFSRYAIKKVEIEMSGSNYQDKKQANKIAEFDKTPKGYTWHHHHDGKSMYLIPKDIHAAVDHTGGSAIVKSKKPLK